MSDPYAPPPPPPDPAVVGALPPSSGPYAPRDHVADGAEAMARVQAEAERATRRFDFGGQTFEFRDTVDARVLIALEREQLGLALGLALRGGASDVDRIMAADEPLTLERFQSLIKTWLESHGTSLGE